jgi:hypothetical protein
MVSGIRASRRACHVFPPLGQSTGKFPLPHLAQNAAQLPTRSAS